MKKYLSLSFLAVLVLFSLMGGVQNARATDDPTPTYVTTLPASDMTTTDATLHAINGDLDADGHSFWVSTSSSFDISTPNIPAGVYSTIDLGFISSTTPFSASLSSATNLPAVTPDTNYYFVAWSLVGSTWHPGSILSVRTASIPVATSTLTIIKQVVNDNGGVATSSDFSLNLFDGSATSTFTGSSTGTIFSFNATTTYDATEEATSSYTSSLSEECSGTINPGENKTCTITNDDVDLSIPNPPTLTIVKHSIGGNGTFTFNVSGATPSTTIVGTTTDGYYTSGYITLTPGTSTVSEWANPGWNFNNVSCVYENESIGEEGDIAGSEIIHVDNGDHVTCTFTNTLQGSESSTSTPDTGSTSDTGSHHSGGHINLPIGHVLGASTDVPSSAVCSAYLTDYMWMGKDNDPTQVTLLQFFLNLQVGANLQLNGFFGPETRDAVKTFQLKYANEILAPWVKAGLLPNISVATGIVYKTTLREINHLVCPALDLPVGNLN